MISNMDRATHLVRECKVVADGHKLMTMGPHTGHTWQVVAYCETAEIALEIANVLAMFRVDISATV